MELMGRSFSLQNCIFGSYGDTSAVPLEVTDSLTIEAAQAEVLFRADSDLMKAVFSFGNAWLESSEKLTLHDPLAAVSVFHPDICRFERGNVQVETKQESDMGGTAFISSTNGMWK